jgi:hypothetical protein
MRKSIQRPRITEDELSVRRRLMQLVIRMMKKSRAMNMASEVFLSHKL